MECNVVRGPADAPIAAINTRLAKTIQRMAVRAKSLVEAVRSSCVILIQPLIPGKKPYARLYKNDATGSRQEPRGGGPFQLRHSYTAAHTASCPGSAILEGSLL